MCAASTRSVPESTSDGFHGGRPALELDIRPPWIALMGVGSRHLWLRERGGVRVETSMTLQAQPSAT